MYQFTTTTVINSNLDSNGTTPKFQKIGDALVVSRVGTFKKDNIVGVYKRPYSAGVLEKATITIPTISTGTTAILSIAVKLSRDVRAEYASSFLAFKKPLLISIVGTGNATNDAATIVNKINALKSRYGEDFISASNTGAVITLQAKDYYQRFDSIKLSIEGTSYNPITHPEYTDSATGTVTVPGKIGFGDDNYMIRSIMLPTLDNNRPFGVNKEERPILGGNYTQFTLRYKVDKQDDGIVAGHYSITNHVFYVKSDLVSDFEGVIDSVTGGNVSGTLELSAPKTAIAVEESVQITVTGAVGSVTFVSAAPAKVTVSSTGLATGVAAGSSVITATDAVGSTGTITITVTA